MIDYEPTGCGESKSVECHFGTLEHLSPVTSSWRHNGQKREKLKLSRTELYDTLLEPEDQADHRYTPKKLMTSSWRHYDVIIWRKLRFFNFKHYFLWFYAISIVVIRKNTISNVAVHFYHIHRHFGALLTILKIILGSPDHLSRPLQALRNLYLVFCVS